MADLDALRAAYRGSQSGNDAGHLSEDRWERLACDELGAIEQQEAFDHILECTSCSDTYRALQILRSEAAEFDAAAPPASVLPADRRVPWRGLGLLAIAATVVLAVVLPLRRSSEPVVDDGSQAVRGTHEVNVSPISPMGAFEWRSGDDVQMKWAASASAPPSVVEILDSDGELIWTGPETSSSEVKWPATEIPGPGRFYWRVLVGGPTSADHSSDLVAFDLVNANPP